MQQGAADDAGEMRPTPPYRESDAMERVFGSGAFNAARNHNAIGEWFNHVPEWLSARGQSPDAPVTVIQVDGHSDLQTNRNSAESIADWGNQVIRHGHVRRQSKVTAGLK